MVMWLWQDRTTIVWPCYIRSTVCDGERTPATHARDGIVPIIYTITAWCMVGWWGAERGQTKGISHQITHVIKCMARGSHSPQIRLCENRGNLHDQIPILE